MLCRKVFKHGHTVFITHILLSGARALLIKHAHSLLTMMKLFLPYVSLQLYLNVLDLLLIIAALNPHFFFSHKNVQNIERFPCNMNTTATQALANKQAY
jgi:hypothetical protein